MHERQELLVYTVSVLCMYRGTAVGNFNFDSRLRRLLARAVGVQA